MLSAIEWAKQFKEPNTWNAGIALKLRLHLDLRICFFYKKIATIIQQHIKDLSLEKKFQTKALVSCDIMDLKSHYTPTYFKF